MPDNPELASACERLRRWRSGDVNPYREMNPSFSSNEREDTERIVAACLAEHDHTPIDAAWLQSMTPGTTHFHFGEMLIVYLAADDNWSAIVGRKASQVSYAVGGFLIKTRGQLRRLIAFTEDVAAIPLNESRTE